MSDGVRLGVGERSQCILVKSWGHPCALTPYGAYAALRLKRSAIARFVDVRHASVFTAQDEDYAHISILLMVNLDDIHDDMPQANKQKWLERAIKGALNIDRLFRQYNRDYTKTAAHILRDPFTAPERHL